MTVKTDIRATYSAELANWQRPVSITRFTSVTDGSGREEGAFIEQTPDEPMWIQAISRGSEEVEARGLAAETTHIGFQHWDGFKMEANDKVYDTDEQGDTKEYDVIRAHLKESHRVAELMLVVRDTE